MGMRRSLRQWGSVVVSVVILLLGIFAPVLAFVIWKGRDDETVTAQDREDYLPGLARLRSAPKPTEEQEP